MKRKIRHEPPMRVKDAVVKYGHNPSWFYHRRTRLSPVPVDMLGLDKRSTWYFEDELRALVRPVTALSQAS